MGQKRVKPRMQLIASLRVFAYGVSFDALDNLLEISSSTARNAFISFVYTMVYELEYDHLRAKN